MGQKDIKIKVVNLLKRMGDFYPSSGLKKFLMEKLGNGCCTLHIGKHVTVLYVSYIQNSSSLQTLARKNISSLGES